jgi:hypothetical protein
LDASSKRRGVAPPRWCRVEASSSKRPPTSLRPFGSVTLFDVATWL